MFYAVKNLVSQAVFEVPEPWTPGLFPLPSFPTKDAYNAWCFNPLTEHAFLTGFEGVTAGVRISEKEATDNQPYKLHALVIDYDAKQDVTERAKLAVEHPPTEYLPAYFYPTYRNMRGVWILEKPINLPPTRKATRKFLDLINKKVQFRKWGAGWEDDTYYQPHKLYATGGAWVPAAPTARIPTALLNFWLFQACQPLRLVDGHAAIPLDRVRAEVETRWPGRWDGPFEEGAQGVCFWHEGAKNPKSTIVHADGCFCFSDDTGKGFWSWKDILGPEFVEKFEADRIGPIKATTLYDFTSEKFYCQTEADEWLQMSKGDFTQKLKCAGFSAKVKQGETASDIDRIEINIKTDNRVAGARPYVYLKPGKVWHSGQFVLNISNVKCLEPAPKGQVFCVADVKREAPFIWQFLSEFFDDPPDAEIPQMTYFLAWLKHTYQWALIHEPQRGQALTLVGPESAGKSFLVDVLLDKLLGGTFDAGKYLVGTDNWTDYISWPVAKVDDVVSSSDHKMYLRYCAILKSMVANTLHTMNTKWGKIGSVWWNGRVIICLNDDAMSKRLIPSLEMSAHTKISLLKVKRTSVIFGDSQAENQTVADRELPQLARFLLEWEIPRNLVNDRDKRYLLKPYHHPDLYAESVQAGSAQSLLEILNEWIQAYSPQYPKDKVWIGKAGELLRLICVTAGMDRLVNNYDSQRLGRELSLLASRNIGIKKLPPHCGLVRYSIPLDMFEATGSVQEARNV